MPEALEEILQDYDSLFCDEMGNLKGTQVTIRVKPDAVPRFVRARLIPYTLRDKVDKELQRFQEAGVINLVDFSEWAAPIVPVLKCNGFLCICGDYKVTINQVALLDAYPLPKVDDLLVTLAGGETFTKLDLAHAYQQLVLEEQSRKLTTINTPRGLFRVHLFPLRHLAPAIFQRMMENLLQGIPKICVYLDDVLVTGCSHEKHLDSLNQVLRRLSDAGMKLKRHKCQFMLPQVQYLGHIISRCGIQPTEDKVQAIREAPTPCDIHQLK